MRMNFFQKLRDFIANPSQSRTMSLLGMLILVSAVSLTVIVSQQQQTLKQHAFNTGNFTIARPIVAVSPSNLVHITVPVTLNNTSRYAADESFRVELIVFQGTALWYNGPQIATAVADDTSHPQLSENLLSGITQNVEFDVQDRLTNYSKRNLHVNVLDHANVNLADAEWDGNYYISTGAQATATPVPTAVPNLFTCANQTAGDAAGVYQCASIINGAVQCPSGYTPYTPASPYTGTSCDSNQQGCCKQNASAAQPNPFICQSQAGTYAGSYQCASIVNGTTQCPEGYSDYQTPSTFTGTSCGTTSGCCKQNPISAPTPTSALEPTPPSGANIGAGNATLSGDTTPSGANVSFRNDATGETRSTTAPMNKYALPAGIYTITFTKTCYEPFVNIATNISPGDNGSTSTRWPLTPSASASCSGGGGPQPTNPPSPTNPPAGNITLVMALNDLDGTTAQTSADITANLALYNLTSNAKVTGAPATQKFAATPIPGKKYSANIQLASLPLDRYFVVLRKSSLIARAIFNVSSLTGSVTVPTTTLVPGDINASGNSKDNIDLQDYNAFKDCWISYRMTKIMTDSCRISDFDNNEKVDQVDFTTLMKGWLIWNMEGVSL